ncbi:ankyrin repeat domain-containing protein [Mucilaginibacter sp. ZT4R22]|uniref:Ankyrin repeat domain-containing protein n=1 Tax=Mucilaginibacter pankratovii TaxID=2772110 RepID=A0ABR7WZQ9_9SPHI|nr:ankyrin repeat domain-containing protein [Mucilaginibacter pankratovii]MBD1367147.1 ankyrin repeat domain-containing protein [Mucilaginibacter pankratovii]
MQTSDITDTIFLQAVEAIDCGDIALLQKLVADNPRLITDRLQTTEEGYFKDPYLLWFVADNPIRHEKLPANIVDITNLLIAAVKAKAPDTAQYQLDYCLGLVATGRIPRDCSVQIPMMDALINAGATPGGGMGALANGNTEAASYLIERGGKLTLGVAIGLRRMDDTDRLLQTATTDEKLSSLTAAAFYGMADMVKFLLDKGVEPNGYPEPNSGFHSHATPLHQAVWSGSLETVRLLVEAGADLNAADKVYGATPLGWAEYAPSEGGDEAALLNFAQIGSYLKSAVNKDADS